MELRPGYKRTEIGVIPEDWDVVQLKEIGSVKNGINKPKEAFGRGNPFVNLMDVFGVPKIRSTDRLGLLLTTEKDRAVYDLRAGDVLFVRSSVKPSGVGLATLVTESLPDTVFSGFLLRFRDNGALIKGYKEFCFHEKRFRKELIENSTVSANTNINQTALTNLHIPVPRSRAEQQAIAAALSDMDASIAALSRLIAKKRDLRHGAMQRLLTGQTRLSGFSSAWQLKTLGEIAHCFSGGTPTTSVREYYNGNIPYITSSDLNQGHIHEVPGRISESGLSNSAAKMVDADTLLIALYGATAGVPAVTRIKAAINQAVLAIVPHKDSVFFIYRLLAHNKERLVEKFTQGGQPNLSGALVKSFELVLPDTAEQSAISNALSDMDSELAALESRLKKSRALKQAMMQALLTGRVRLPVRSDVAPPTKEAAHA